MDLKRSSRPSCATKSGSGSAFQAARRWDVGADRRWNGLLDGSSTRKTRVEIHTTVDSGAACATLCLPVRVSECAGASLVVTGMHVLHSHKCVSIEPSHPSLPQSTCVGYGGDVAHRWKHFFGRNSLALSSSASQLLVLHLQSTSRARFSIHVFFFVVQFLSEFVFVFFLFLDLFLYRSFDFLFLSHLFLHVLSFGVAFFDPSIQLFLFGHFHPFFSPVFDPRDSLDLFLEVELHGSGVHLVRMWLLDASQSTEVLVLEQVLRLGIGACHESVLRFLPTDRAHVHAVDLLEVPDHGKRSATFAVRRGRFHRAHQTAPFVHAHVSQHLPNRRIAGEYSLSDPMGSWVDVPPSLGVTLPGIGWMDGCHVGPDPGPTERRREGGLVS